MSQSTASSPLTDDFPSLTDLVKRHENGLEKWRTWQNNLISTVIVPCVVAQLQQMVDELADAGKPFNADAFTHEVHIPLRGDESWNVERLDTGHLLERLRRQGLTLILSSDAIKVGDNEVVLTIQPFKEKTAARDNNAAADLPGPTT